MSNDKRKSWYFQFYPNDWNNDPLLRLCSLSAQALWIRMLGVMHTCEPYGHLTFTDGLPATPRQISQVTGVHTNRVTPLVTELQRHGVFSKTRGGVIYSRRMVRDEANRLINKQNGKNGGNPKLVNPVNPPVNPPDNTPVNLIAVSVTNSGTSTPNTLVASGEATHEKIPYEEIRTAYNERRGALPKAGSFSDAAKKKIRVRWAQHSDVEFWKTLFDKAGKSERMVAWADFHWFMKSELNIEKTLNGNYDNDRERRAVPVAKPPPPPKEIKLTPEQEEMNAVEARKFFSAFRKKRGRGGGLVPVADVISDMREEELSV